MIDTLIEMLCRERGERTPTGMTEQEKADYFRALCNVRPPSPVSEKFLSLQDRYLKARFMERQIEDVNAFKYRDDMALWQGDITRLKSDAIVNACNSALLGCFHPLHNCIDNVIHSNAGVQVRLDCHKIMNGAYLPNGEVVVTSAYNLPSSFIFHTVGPIVEGGQPSRKNAADLKSCYRACLEKSGEMGLGTLTLCCLSTGVFGYPKDLAARLAVDSVREQLPKVNQGKGRRLKVIFNVFTDEDRDHYERELSTSIG